MVWLDLISGAGGIRTPGGSYGPDLQSGCFNQHKKGEDYTQEGHGRKSLWIPWAPGLRLRGEQLDPSPLRPLY